jgi:iron(III) transport system substrate-binding protein
MSLATGQLPAQATAQALAQGWRAGMVLIKKIGGNTRDLSDGASFAVREVVRGDVTAAMAIDFQARCEEEYAYTLSGQHRLVFTAPVGGTSVSADPISLLRGSPHREMAVAFMHFVLSPEGQRLLDRRIGTPGGPEHTALRRMPVRKDCYTAADRQLMSDPDADPFAVAASFTYHPAWTAPYYTLLSRVIRAVVMDPRPELTRAWRAILDAGGPERVPRAWEEFCWIPFTYAEAPAMEKILDQNDVGETLPLQRTWTVQAQEHYRRCETLARSGQ